MNFTIPVYGWYNINNTKYIYLLDERKTYKVIMTKNGLEPQGYIKRKLK